MNLFFGRTLHKFDRHDDHECSVSEYCSKPDLLAAVPAEADLVSSVIVGSQHAPVIDIDMPCQLVESSPGHFHLYVDKPVPWDKYLAMLEAMANAGIVQWGYVKASQRRGYSSVRVPWKLKEKQP